MAHQDWTQPPTSGTVEPLGSALHDGTLLRIASDRLARTVRLVVELGFPAPPEPCPDVVEISLAGVTHALVFVRRNWPGPVPPFVTPATPEMEAATEEYRRWGRAETVGLGELAQRLADDERMVEVMHGALHRAENGLTLILDGYGDLGAGDDGPLGDWWEIRIGAEALDVVLPDGSPLGLSELLRLGQAGWVAWANEAQAR